MAQSEGDTKLQEGNGHSLNLISEKQKGEKNQTGLGFFFYLGKNASFVLGTLPKFGSKDRVGKPLERQKNYNALPSAVLIKYFPFGLKSSPKIYPLFPFSVVDSHGCRNWTDWLRFGLDPALVFFVCLSVFSGLLLEALLVSSDFESAKINK